MELVIPNVDSNEKYLKLITSEYATKQKFNSYVEAFLNLVSPTVNNYLAFNTIFNLENAVGDQLDKLGELVGISRKLPTDVENIPSVLTDELYRLVIRAKIYKDHWDGTREQMEEIFQVFFPDAPFEIVDNQDMSYTVNVISPEMSDTMLALITNGFILPKPAGVRVNYNVLDTTLFGWDVENAFIDGWDKGQWSTN